MNISSIKNKLTSMSPRQWRLIILGLLMCCVLSYAAVWVFADRAASQAPSPSSQPAVAASVPASKSPQIAPLPQMPAQVINTAQGPAMPATSGIYPPLPPPPDGSATQGIGGGISMFQLQAAKEQKELQAAIGKAETDIKKSENERRKEEIKATFYTRFPEMVFEGKVDFPKPPAPESVKTPSRVDMLDQIRLVGIVKDRAIWETPAGRTVTATGSVIAGYTVSRVKSDGVELEKDGRLMMVLL